MVSLTGAGPVFTERGNPMSHTLAARYTTVRARAIDAFQRRDAEAGLTTIEWALVTLMVCAFAVAALGALSTVGKTGVAGLIGKAFALGGK